MPIVTTSARKRPHRHSSLVTRHSSLAIAALAAIAIAVLVALHCLRKGPASSGPEPPKVSDTTAKTASPAGSPAAAAPSAATGGAASGRAESSAGEPPASTGEANRQTVQPSNRPTTVSAEDEPASPDSPPPKPPKHFRHPSEQLLAMMLSTPPDIQMPPLPHLDPDDERLNADALTAATNDLVIYETDGKELESLKESVAGVKFQLADVVAKGGNVAEALNEFRNHQNEGVEIRNETIKAINSIEDDQAAAETFKKANEELVKEDIVPIRPEEVGFVSAEDGGDEPDSSDSR